MLESLTAVLRTLSANIQLHRVLLSENETRTRVVLIDPLLRALDWDTGDPSLVQTEFPVPGTDGIGRADYVLLNNGKPLMAIEAKRLGDEQMLNHLKQSRYYAAQIKAPYFALTDGNVWWVYTAEQSNAQMDFPLFDCNIKEAENLETLAIRLLLLWRPNLSRADGPVHNLANFQLGKVQKPGIEESQSGTSATLNWCTLKDYKQVFGRPACVQLPDGTIKPVKFWKDILLHIAEYLADDRTLNAKACPISTPTGSRYIAAHGHGTPTKLPSRVRENFLTGCTWKPVSRPANAWNTPNIFAAPYTLTRTFLRFSRRRMKSRLPLLNLWLLCEGRGVSRFRDYTFGEHYGADFIGFDSAAGADGGG